MPDVEWTLKGREFIHCKFFFQSLDRGGYVIFRNFGVKHFR